jgi:hypothetical protein
MLLSLRMRRYIEGKREDPANMKKVVRMMLWVLVELLPNGVLRSSHSLGLQPIGVLLAHILSLKV